MKEIILKREDALLKKINHICQKIGNPPDFVSRTFQAGEKNFALVFIKEISNEQFISKSLLPKIFEIEGRVTLAEIKNEVVTFSNCTETTFEEIISKILVGSACLFDSSDMVLSFDVATFPKRAVTEPPTSAVIKGSREGFIENIFTNIAIIRKRLNSKDLRFKEFDVGSVTKTKVIISYIEGIASQQVVDDISEKISDIKINGVIESNYVAAFLSESPNSVFKQVGSAEKPDIIAGKLLEGRVAIFVDNSPIILTLPFIILEDLQSSDDYYSNSYHATFVRVLRLFGIFLAVIVPGAYLALRLYHYKLIPFKFLVTISNSTQGLPFTPFVEMFFILLMFELLYEVSLRLPRYLGIATSIVGALVLGDTGVKAGLISPPGVMIIALSVIALYTMPDQRSQISIFRMMFLLLGATLGMVGILVGILILIIEMASLKSYSASYLAPFAPFILSDQKDGIYKSPLRAHNSMPKSFPNKKNKRGLE